MLIDLANLSADDRAEFEQINAELHSLAKRRREKIDILDEPYRRSKIAWKIGVLSNALIYRQVALADGVAAAWNQENYLSAILNGRAMVETAAFYWDFAKRFRDLAAIPDFGAVDALAMNSLFGTKDKDLLCDHPEHEARQILKSIDLIDRTVIPHFRSHYDSLSEFCHPNSFGHRGLFSQLDHHTGIASFASKGRERFVSPIKCALGTAAILAIALNATEAIIIEFANAHHAAHPSPAVETDQ